MKQNDLELRGVCKRFAGFRLEDIGLELPKGYIMGLVGPNGAGKTTTIRLILNMLEKDAGRISVFGLDHVRDERKIKQQLGIVFDSVFYAENWTVQETGRAISPFYEAWEQDVFEGLLERFELPRKTRVGALSRGMQMKLMLACALSHRARLLILDEPTSGLDPATRSELLDLLQEYIQDGEKSVLFSTHITTDLERIADYVTVLNRGTLFYTGTLDGLLQRYRLVRGKIKDLTPQLEACVVGLRRTEVGFEGLIAAEEARQYRGCVADVPSLEDIVVCVSKRRNAE